MNRLDVYTAVHKMQRARLFEVTVDAGRVDPTDSLAVARIAAAIEALGEELSLHAEHERRFIHPVLRLRAPELADALDADHVLLDGRLDQLRAVARASVVTLGDPNGVYRALAAFTAAYLEHLTVEEGQALQALWESCSDEELAGILGAFRDSRSDVENLTSLIAELATLNPQEILRMLAIGLGPVSIEDLSEILATVLTPAQFGAARHLFDARSVA